MMPLVYVVDGAAERRGTVQYALQKSGHTVEIFATSHALEFAVQERPAAMVIALELPDGDGLELCRQARRDPRLSRTRIVLLGNSAVSKYRALVESGADDCVIWPLAPGEIEAVVKSVMQTPLDSDSAFKDAGDIVINSFAMRVAVQGKEIPTTTLEFRLLDYMARHQGKVFSRDALLDAVWGDLQFVTPRSVDACVRRIRKKIEPRSSSPTFLKSVRGVGYKLDAKPFWENSADFCQCSICSAARLRAKSETARDSGRGLSFRAERA